MSDIFIPTFLRLLKDPSIDTILLAGTGGGFDHCHAVPIIEILLKQWNKKVIIHSYSFGDPTRISNSQPFSFPEDVPQECQPQQKEGGKCWPEVRIVDKNCVGSRDYAPEVAIVKFLDEQYPGMQNLQRRPPTTKTTETSEKNSENNDNNDKNWFLYASYARDWVPSSLSHFYECICRIHDVKAVVCIDGGSDSIMCGAESGLGDPIEDCCTIASVNALPEENNFVPIRILVSIGFGCDRFNGVSDRDSFKAIAELTKMYRAPLNKVEEACCGRDQSTPEERANFNGVAASSTSAASLGGETSINNGNKVMNGFLGTFTLEKFQPPAQQYQKFVSFCHKSFHFRSVIANSIIESANGNFGSEVVPPSLMHRVQPGQLDLGPLMSILFAFDVRLLAKRSLLVPYLMKAKTVEECYDALSEMRKKYCSTD